MLDAFDPVDIRHAAGGNDYDVGIAGEHISGFGAGIEMHRDPKALKLGFAPIDDAQQILAPARDG